jgi:hypothetical protein
MPYRKPRSSKQRAASIRNLVAARRKRSRVSASTFTMAPGVRGKIRVSRSHGGGPMSEMRNSPNKRQRKALGQWNVRNNATGRIERVGYKAYRTAKRKDAHHEIRSRLSPYSTNVPKFKSHKQSTLKVGKRSRRTMRQVMFPGGIGATTGVTGGDH